MGKKITDKDRIDWLSRRDRGAVHLEWYPDALYATHRLLPEPMVRFKTYRMAVDHIIRLERKAIRSDKGGKRG